MKSFISFVVVIAILAAAAWGYVRFLGGDIPLIGAYLAGRPDAESKDDKEEGGKKEDEEKPKDVTATVKAAVVRKGVISESRVMYGSVVPGKGSLGTVSAPFESKVLRILVRRGQEVAKGEPLIEVGPSEDSRLALEQAQNKAEMAKQELERVKQRLGLKLATNQELIQATEASRDADLLVKSLSRKGVAKPVTLQAESPGVVNSIAVQEGAVVTTGAALLDVAILSKLEVQLGVEPEWASSVHEGQTITVSNLGKGAASKLECPVRGIARTVNAATHLVDVFVTLPSEAPFLLGAAVQGDLTVKSEETLIVPRSVALPEEDHFVVFLLKDGHAHKVEVERGMENGKETEIHSDAVHEGDQVAELGAYELEDGMAVTTGDAS